MFEPFQKFMTKAANRHGINREMRAAEICQHFRTLIPEIFRQKDSPQTHISPAHFKGSTLTVNVATQAWAQEVIMRKEKIINEMNEKAGKTIIKKLHTQLRQT